MLFVTQNFNFTSSTIIDLVIDRVSSSSLKRRRSLTESISWKFIHLIITWRPRSLLDIYDFFSNPLIRFLEGQLREIDTSNHFHVLRYKHYWPHRLDVWPWWVTTNPAKISLATRLKRSCLPQSTRTMRWWKPVPYGAIWLHMVERSMSKMWVTIPDALRCVGS
jgi:hypothetical protein